MKQTSTRKSAKPTKTNTTTAKAPKNTTEKLLKLKSNLKGGRLCQTNDCGHNCTRVR